MHTMWRVLVAGNWKMFNGPSRTDAFFDEFDRFFESRTNDPVCVG